MVYVGLRYQCFWVEFGGWCCNRLDGCVLVSFARVLCWVGFDLRRFERYMVWLGCFVVSLDCLGFVWLVAARWVWCLSADFV